VKQNDDGTYEFGLDLGRMSDEKVKIVEQHMKAGDHDCDHPLSGHTGTEATWPWLLCAHVPCPCQILSD
jgi:hypothetical protein